MEVGWLADVGGGVCWSARVDQVLHDVENKSNPTADSYEGLAT